MTPLTTMISAADLSSLIERGEVKLLDASWYLPAQARNPYQEFLAARIPGARFFDIDRIADPGHSLPHMLPSPDQFALEVEALGVGSDDLVVIYDSKGLFSAPRAWWMFRVFGHRRVHILSGGLPGWNAAGLPLETGDECSHHVEANFRADFQAAWVADQARLRSTIDGGGALVLDARSPSRFAGEEPEPRPGVRPGHMPGSRNLHYARVLTEDGQRLKPEAELRQIFAATGIDDADAVITTCGSGISACLLALALQ